MNRDRIERIIGGLENLITILVVTCIVAFCGWLIMGAGL